MNPKILAARLRRATQALAATNQAVHLEVQEIKQAQARMADDLTEQKEKHDELALSVSQEKTKL